MKFLKRKKKKKETKSLENNKSPLLDKYPYRFSDLYTYHGGKVSTVVRLFVRPGSNKNLTFIQILRLIPSSILDDLKIVFAITDKVVKDKEKQAIIKENAKKNKNTIEGSATKTGNKDEDFFVKDEDNTKDKLEIKQSEIYDYDSYEAIIQSNEPIVAFDIKMMITGNDVGTIEDFITNLNISLNKKYDGLNWDSLTGDARDDFLNFLTQHRENNKVLSSTGENYSILNFTMSAGLNDMGGVPIGKDALSFFNSTSFFDFNTSTKSKAIISMPKTSIMANYKRDNNTYPKTASLIAQATANHVAMNGNRVFHIVLNDFDYSEGNLFYRPKETFEKNIFEKNDVSRLTINPMQGYGDLDDVVNIFSRLKTKIVNMFDILNDFDMTINDKTTILDALNSFYVNNKLWTSESAQHPEKSHIVNIAKPETYVTMGRFISSFTSFLSEAKNEGRELKIDRVEALKSLLEDALTSYQFVLGRTSTIKKSSALQTYYDFNNIADRKVKQVQLLNLLDFVLWQTKENDLVVIHGFDTVDKRLLFMVEETINNAIDNKKVRFLFSFDSISNEEFNNTKNLDMFDLKGPIYRNLDSDIDWTIVGTALPNEIKKYENALNLALSSTIKSNMGRVTNSMALIHRRTGAINNFAYMNVII